MLRRAGGIVVAVWLAACGSSEAAAPPFADSSDAGEEAAVIEGKPIDDDLNPYGKRYPSTNVGTRPRGGTLAGERLANLRIRAIRPAGDTFEWKSLALFFDPERRSHDLVVLITIPLWQESLNDALLEKVRPTPRVRFAFFIIEGRTVGKAATEADVLSWRTDKGTDWMWNVHDPDQQLVTMFSAQGYPHLVFLDSRNMEILRVEAGVPLDFADLLDSHLADVRSRPPAFD